MLCLEHKIPDRLAHHLSHHEPPPAPIFARDVDACEPIDWGGLCISRSRAVQDMCNAQRQAPQLPRPQPHRRCSICRSNMLALRQRLHVRQDHRVKARIPITFAPEHLRRRSPRFPPSRLVRHLPSGRAQSSLGGCSGQVSHNPKQL